MARKRNAKGHFVKGGGRSEARTVRMRRPAGTTSIIKVSAPRAPAVRHKRRRASSGGGGGGGGGLLGRAGAVAGRHQRMALGIGALALGWAHKNGHLAKIPIVGKAGPVTSAAILGWALEDIMHMKLPGIVSNAVTAAIVLSAFNYTASGGTQLLGDEPAMSYPGGAVFFD